MKAKPVRLVSTEADQDFDVFRTHVGGLFCLVIFVVWSLLLIVISNSLSFLLSYSKSVRILCCAQTIRVLHMPGCVLCCHHLPDEVVSYTFISLLSHYSVLYTFILSSGCLSRVNYGHRSKQSFGSAVFPNLFSSMRLPDELLSICSKHGHCSPSAGHPSNTVRHRWAFLSLCCLLLFICYYYKTWVAVCVFPAFGVTAQLSLMVTWMWLCSYLVCPLTLGRVPLWFWAEFPFEFGTSY